MSRIEDEFMRGNLSRILKADLLKDLEASVSTLEQNVLLTSTVRGVQELKNRDTPYLNQIPTRPKLTPYSSGRDDELTCLLKLLAKYGSVVITQYGGARKTQLMVALANLAEKRELITGGTFWDTADGTEEQVMGSVSSFVEQLTGLKIRHEDLMKIEIVVAALCQKLRTMDGRWLICIDNADDADANGVSGESCDLPHTSQGWVAVTSRQGRPTSWEGMKLEQKLELKPLSVIMEMVVLWRWRNAKKCVSTSDEEALAQLELLKASNMKEYDALQNLIRSFLGGIPLALLQAGSYIQQHRVLFFDHLHIYEAMRQRAALNPIMSTNEACEVLHDEQRSIWTTWKISLSTMTNKARRTLNVIALCSNFEIVSSLIKKVVDEIRDEIFPLEVAYLNLVMGQLVAKGSLLQVRTGLGEEVFDVHPLIREFIRIDLNAKEEELMRAVEVGVDSIQFWIKQWCSNVRSPSEEMLENIRKVVDHAMRITLPCFDETLEKIEVCNTARAIDLVFFTQRSLEHMGRLDETAQISKKLMKLLEKRHGKKTDH